MAGVERKTPRELAVMREAGRILALTLAAMRQEARPGVTTRQLDQVAEAVIAAHPGARPAFKGYPGPYPYPYATTISVNDQLVHGLPGQRVLREGDLVKLDCGVWYQGFYADAALTVGIGALTPTAQRLLDVTAQALSLGIAQAQVGQRIGHISAAIEAHIRASGYYPAAEYTGHGIGRQMHEDPEVPNEGRAGRGFPLKAGMTLAIEPMVIVGTPHTRTLADQWTVASQDGSLTAHFEHTVAITEAGPVILTALDADPLTPVVDKAINTRYN